MSTIDGFTEIFFCFKREQRPICPKTKVSPLDDLVAELDCFNQEKVLQLLTDQQSQLFITCTDANTILTHLNTVSSKVMKIDAGNIQ